MKHTKIVLLACSLGLVGTILPAEATSSDIPNPLIDYAGHREAVIAVERLRYERRLTEAEFLRLACEPGTIVLDARSASMFQRLHVEGAGNLSFPDFTTEALAGIIPSTDTRILIYCNNNFLGSPTAMPSKKISAALNISTFVALHSYGYTQVYELGPLLDVKTTALPLAGSETRKRPIEAF